MICITSGAVHIYFYTNEYILHIMQINSYQMRQNEKYLQHAHILRTHTQKRELRQEHTQRKPIVND